MKARQGVVGVRNHIVLATLIVLADSNWRERQIVPPTIPIFEGFVNTAKYIFYCLCVCTYSMIFLNSHGKYIHNHVVRKLSLSSSLQ